MKAMKRKSRYTKNKNFFFKKNLKLNPLIIIAGNWVFQGMKYMDKYELSLKIFIDLIITFYIKIQFNQLNLYYSFFIAHSINWILNGHFFTLSRYVYPFPKKKADFEKFINIIRIFSKNLSFINAVLIYGSYCRNELNELSDLDVRVLVKNSLLNGMAGAIFCFILRFLALILTFPLDIYIVSNKKALNRLNPSEIPIKIK